MKIRNGIIVLLAVFLAGCFSNIFSQSCVGVSIQKANVQGGTIIDSTEFSATEINNGIQITCENQDSLYIMYNVFAPGASESYIYEKIPYDPPYEFNSGTEYILPRDDCWGMVMGFGYNRPPEPEGTPKFVFSFFDQTYEQCVIGSNSILSFDLSVASQSTECESSCAYSYGASIPSNNNLQYKNCIFGPYHDIHFLASRPDYPGHMYFQVLGEYPCRQIVLSYYEVPLYASQTNKLATHMMVLYETTNTVEFYMQNKPITTSTNSGKAILGMQNADGTKACVIDTTIDGVTYNYNSTVWETTNEAWRMIPQGGTLESTIEWFKRAAFDYDADTIPIGAIHANGQDSKIVRIDPTQEDGPTRYFSKATIYAPAIDGQGGSYTEEIIIWDSSAVYYPIELPSVIISRNGNIGLKDTVCRGGEINFELSGGGDHGKYHQVAPTEISDIGSTFTRTNDPNADSVVYVFKVENYDEYGVLVCTRYDSCVVYNQSFNVNIGEDLVICRNDEIELTDLLKESEGTSTWSTGYTGDTLRYAPQQTEQIILTKTDALGCQAMDTMTVTVNDAPDVTISGIMSICKGTSTTLTANSSIGGCQFEWNTGETTQSITVTPEDDSTYKVSVKLPPAMCETIAETTVDVQEIPNVQASEDKLICEEETAQISVTGDASRYIWETLDPQVNGSNQINLVVSPKGTTKYTVHAYNEINCHNSDEVMVVVQAKPTPVINLDPGVIDALDPAVILTDASSGNTSREWTISDGTTSTDEQFLHRFELSDTSMRFDIKLVAVSENGCVDSTSTFIRVKRDHYLWAPTGIYLHDTDQRNREFRLWIDNIVEYDLMIFNRYGEMIFRTNNIEQAWDCTYKGETVPQGVYTWIVKYRHNDAPNREESQKGTFMIYN